MKNGKTFPARLRSARSGLTFGGQRPRRAAAAGEEGLTFALGHVPAAPAGACSKRAGDDRWQGGLRLVASGGYIV